MDTDTQTSTGLVPEWDLADRMRKALRHADIGMTEMADYLEVNRNTIGNWVNGHTRPTAATLRAWALRTGVQYDWLRGANPQVGVGCITRTEWSLVRTSWELAA